MNDLQMACSYASYLFSHGFQTWLCTLLWLETNLNLISFFYISVIIKNPVFHLSLCVYFPVNDVFFQMLMSKLKKNAFFLFASAPKPGACNRLHCVYCSTGIKQNWGMPHVFKGYGIYVTKLSIT